MFFAFSVLGWLVMMFNKNILMALPLLLSCNYTIADTNLDSGISSANNMNKCPLMIFRLSDIESRLRAYLEPEFDKVKNTEILAAETYNYLVGDIDSNLPDEILTYRNLLTKYNSMCTSDVTESPRATFSLKDFIRDYDEYIDWVKLDHVKDPESIKCEQLFQTESSLINQIKSLGDVTIDDSKKHELQKPLIRYKFLIDIDMANHKCWKYNASEFIAFYQKP